MSLSPEVSSLSRGRDRLAGILHRPYARPFALSRAGRRCLWCSAGPSGGQPFPVHVQALLGTVRVVWLVRVVGRWWLGAALLYLSSHHGLRP